MELESLPMLFNSYIFVFCFLPLVLALWWHPSMTVRMRLGALVAGSYLFYGWWDYRFVSLLMLSTVVDYVVGHRIDTTKVQGSRRGWLVVSMCVNLGLLGFFKYSGFFATSINALTEWLRVGGAIPVPEIVLPIGISFYTFQTMSYAIDIYRGQAKPARSLWHFAAYVSLFPQLIAGPIVRYHQIDEQLRSLQSRINWKWCARGIIFFVAGMCQKVLLADTIAAKINPMFSDYAQLALFGSWFAMLGYTTQLYFDFAGYSNMAVGLGLTLGFEFPQNFDSPYKSASIAEFWRRWHMTLSQFLRDYLFIPLGGSHHGRLLTLRNLVVVMLLGGLWHGAGWTFVLWGLYHGALLAGHSAIRQRGTVRLPQFAAIALTFVAVVFGWVLFRSTDLVMASHLIRGMCGLNGWETNVVAACGGVGAIGILLVWLLVIFMSPNIWQLRIPPTFTSAIVLAILFVACVLRFDVDSPFLYFQF